MLGMLKKFVTWLKSFIIVDEPEEIVETPLYLSCNGLYIARIEAIERSVEQTKIDYAIGFISKETFDRKFEEFQNQVKELSAAYARELLLYSA